MTPAERIKRICEECSGVWSASGINQRDRDFMQSVEQRNPATLTPKQEKWLADIEERAFT